MDSFGNLYESSQKLRGYRSLLDHSLALEEQQCPPGTDAYLHRSISGLETVCRVPAAFLRWNLWFEPYSNTSGDGLCKLYSCYVPWLCALANWSLGIQSDQCHRPRHPGKSHGAREALVPVLLAPRKKAWWATWIWPHLICIQIWFFSNQKQPTVTNQHDVATQPPQRHASGCQFLKFLCKLRTRRTKPYPHLQRNTWVSRKLYIASLNGFVERNTYREPWSLPTQNRDFYRPKWRFRAKKNLIQLFLMSAGCSVPSRLCLPLPRLHLALSLAELLRCSWSFYLKSVQVHIFLSPV